LTAPLALVISGNSAWLRGATILLACSGISDSFFRWIAGGPFPEWGWNSVVDTVTGSTGTEATVAGPATALPLWWAILIAVFVVWQAWLNLPALRNLFSPAQLMNASFNRWGLGNAYGAFGSMTETRDEIIIEGWIDPGPVGSDSDDDRETGDDGRGAHNDRRAGDDGPADRGADDEGPAADDGWREYRFKGKPGDVSRISPLIAPYHLRLD